MKQAFPAWLLKNSIFAAWTSGQFIRKLCGCGTSRYLEAPSKTVSLADTTRSPGPFQVSPLQRTSRDGESKKNNLAHCFSYGENFNNIDLMMIQGHDFLPAVEILNSWLDEYRRDLGRSSPSVQSAAK